MGNPVVKNYIDPITGELVIGGEIQINGTMTVGEDATLTGMTPEALNAAGTSLGGVKAAAAGAGDTVECKINGTTKKLYVQALAAATDETLGGVIADEATEDDTVEVKIGEDHKLYVPTYPTDATESVSGLVKAAANQAISDADGVAALLVDFNALLAKLKAAGLMTDDT